MRPPVCRAKQSAPRSDQIELDITAATVGLKIALALAVGPSLYVPALQLVNKASVVAFAYRLHKGKTMGQKSWRVRIIKEQPANTALFVCDVEVE